MRNALEICIFPAMRPLEFNIGPIQIQPATVLAPMEGITDRAFRRLIRRLGGCGLTVTEFISSDQLSKKSKRAWRMAEFDPDEHPVSIQIYGRSPEQMADAARMCADMGADIVDLNLGCPSKRVTGGLSGCALMREPELASDHRRRCPSLGGKATWSHDWPLGRLLLCQFLSFQKFGGIR